MLVTMSFAGSSGGRAAGAAAGAWAPAAAPPADGGTPPDAGADTVAGGVQPASNKHATSSAGESLFIAVPLATERPQPARGGHRTPRRPTDRRALAPAGPGTSALAPAVP